MKFPQRDTINHSKCNAAISKIKKKQNQIFFSRAQNGSFVKLYHNIGVGIMIG